MTYKPNQSNRVGLAQVVKCDKSVGNALLDDWIISSSHSHGSGFSLRFLLKQIEDSCSGVAPFRFRRGAARQTAQKRSGARRGFAKRVESARSPENISRVSKDAE